MAAGKMIPYRCAACGGETEQFFFCSTVPPQETVCEHCGGDAEQTLSLPGMRSPRAAQSFKSIVVDQAADGEYSIPGHSGATVPEGFVRRELRTVEEVRAFERDINRQERSDWERSQEREQRGFEAGQRERRAELQHRMGTMSNSGRQLARLAIEQNNSRPRRQYGKETYFEAFSKDASNREASRSELTDWKAVRR